MAISAITWISAGLESAGPVVSGACWPTLTASSVTGWPGPADSCRAAPRPAPVLDEAAKAAARDRKAVGPSPAEPPRLAVSDSPVDSCSESFAACPAPANSRGASMVSARLHRRSLNAREVQIEIPSLLARHVLSVGTTIHCSDWCSLILNSATSPAVLPVVLTTLMATRFSPCRNRLETLNGLISN